MTEKATGRDTGAVRSVPSEDAREQLADRVASRLLGSPPPGRATARAGDHHLKAPEVAGSRSSDRGRRLTAGERAILEPRAQASLEDVRVVETPVLGPTAAALNETILLGPIGGAGRTRALAHEIGHVLHHRDGVLRRDPPRATPEPPKPKIAYARAAQANTAYSGADSLGWATKLTTVANAAFASWATLWTGGKANEFADGVAQHQIALGFTGNDVDGVLGPTTWARIAGIGEAMAGISGVHSPGAEYTCTLATRERIQRAHKMATGKTFTLPSEKDATTYNIILQTIESRMRDIDVQYRGTGAAGAIVYAGLGAFVPEADIWAGKLKPGAAMQVWKHRNAYDLLVAGEKEVPGESGTTKRAIRSDDADFYGTSFVFVRYDASKADRVWVRHFGRLESMDRSEWAVWVAANVN